MVVATIGKDGTLHLRDRIGERSAQQFIGFLL
jgi:hypothetical protein